MACKDGTCFPRSPKAKGAPCCDSCANGGACSVEGGGSHDHAKPSRIQNTFPGGDFGGSTPFGTTAYRQPAPGLPKRAPGLPKPTVTTSTTMSFPRDAAKLRPSAPAALPSLTQQQPAPVPARTMELTSTVASPGVLSTVPPVVKPALPSLSQASSPTSGAMGVQNRRVPATYYGTSGDPPPAAPPVLLPAELAGRITQADWAGMDAPTRANITAELAAGRTANAQVAADAAKQRLLAGIGQGLAEAGRQASALINSVNQHALDVRREDHAAESSQRTAEAQMYAAETARMIATLQQQQAAAGVTGNTAASTQLASMIAALQQAQAQVVPPPAPPATDNTALYVAGAVALVAVAAAVVLSRPRSNPARSRPQKRRSGRGYVSAR